MAALASPVMGMDWGSTSSCWPSHSAATWAARACDGTTKGARAGVRIGLPSSVTVKPPSAPVTDTAL